MGKEEEKAWKELIVDREKGEKKEVVAEGNMKFWNRHSLLGLDFSVSES